MSSSRRYRAEYDGIVFAYALSREWFALKLFRVVTLARIRLDRIVYVRQRAMSDLGEFVSGTVRRPFRNWYWPHPLFMGGAGRHAPYVIDTDNGSRIFVRLRTGFHYRLRDAIGRAKVSDEHAAADRAAAERAMEAAGWNR